MSAKFHYSDERTPFAMMLTRFNFINGVGVDKAHGIRVAIDYFHIQAMTVFERRDTDKVLHEKWRVFELIQNGTGLFEQCRGDAKLWPEVLRFLEYKDPFYTPQPEPNRPWPPEKPKREMDASDFFKVLQDRVKRSEMPARQKDFVNLGILFLFAESHLPREKRVPLEERKYWIMIWPLLEKYGVMREFRRSYELKCTIEKFLESKKRENLPDNLKKLPTAEKFKSETPESNGKEIS